MLPVPGRVLPVLVGLYATAAHFLLHGVHLSLDVVVICVVVKSEVQAFGHLLIDGTPVEECKAGRQHGTDKDHQQNSGKLKKKIDMSRQLNSNYTYTAERNSNVTLHLKNNLSFNSS